MLGLQVAGNHHALDFAGALVNLGNARVAVMAFNRIIFQIAVTAVDL